MDILTLNNSDKDYFALDGHDLEGHDLEGHDLQSISSNDERHCFPLYLRIWVSLASGIIFIIGIFGNSLVPILIWKNKQFRYSTNIFLLNLALADVLVLLVCLPTALVELHTIPNTWVLGSFLCHLVPFVEISVSRASIFTLTVISVERYIAICKPLRSTSMCTRCRAMAISIAIWPISLLAAGPMLVATEYQEVIHTNGSTEYVCITSVNNIWIFVYFVGSAGGFFLIPLLFLASVYFIINKKLNQVDVSRNKIDNSQWNARKQVANMLGAVVIIFFICLLPFQVFTVWLILSSPETVNSLGPHIYFNILFACRVLIYINSAVNPIIYNAMSAKFRKALLKLFRFSSGQEKISLRRRSTITTTLSSSSSTSSSFRRRTSLAIQRNFSEISSWKKNNSFISTTLFKNKGGSHQNAKNNLMSNFNKHKTLKYNESSKGTYMSSLDTYSTCNGMNDENLPLSSLTSSNNPIKPLLHDSRNENLNNSLSDSLHNNAKTSKIQRVSFEYVNTRS